MPVLSPLTRYQGGRAAVEAIIAKYGMTYADYSNYYRWNLPEWAYHQTEVQVFRVLDPLIGHANEIESNLTWEATSHRTYMPTESLLERVIQLLGSLRLDHGFSISTSDDQTSPFGAWVRLESDEFFVDVIRDRGQEWIEVTSKIRPRPRAPRRGWPLGHVLAYLNGAADPYPN